MTHYHNFMARKHGRKTAQRKKDKAASAAAEQEEAFEQAKERGECWCSGYYAFDESLPNGISSGSGKWVRCPIHSA